jgi:uncharacterized membrane protein YeaQ/YmgE (transglycosylase-associated protein family)
METAVAYVFACVLGAIVALLLAQEFRPAKLLQSWGTDIGLKVFALPAPWYAFDPPEDHNETPFVFLDLIDSCEAFLGSQELPEFGVDGSIVTPSVEDRCKNQAEPPAELLKAIIEGFDRQAKQESGDAEASSDPAAKALIIDYRLPSKNSLEISSRKAISALHKMLTQDEGVPIIAAAGLDVADPDTSSQDADLNPLLEGPLISSRDRVVINEDRAWSLGRLRQASFLSTLDADVKDATLRGFPVAVKAYDLSENAESQIPPSVLLPSAPFLAALIAESPDGLALADRLFYGAKAQLTSKQRDALLAEQSVLSRAIPAARAPETSTLKTQSHEELLQSLRSKLAQDGAVQRQVFSFYSLSMPVSDQQTEAARERQDRLERFYYGGGLASQGLKYERLRLKDLQSDDGGIESLFQRIDFAGKVVVVGTSAFESFDWHRTPLGDMPGAEVLINSARAFLHFDPMALESSFWALFLDEMKLALFAAFGLLLPTILREYATISVKQKLSHFRDGPDQGASASTFQCDLSTEELRADWPERGLQNAAPPQARGAGKIVVLLGALPATVLWFVALGLGIIGAFAFSILLPAWLDEQRQSIDFLIPTLMVLFESAVEFSLMILAVIRWGLTSFVRTAGNVIGGVH